MMQLYSLAAQRIEAHALQLALQMDEAIANGQRVSPSWLFQNERMQRLRVQIENEIARFADDAAAHTAGMQREFAFTGAVDTQDLITITRDNVTKMRGLSAQPDPAAVALGFAKLPAEAAIDLVGFASDGSPLADLFNALGPSAAEAIKQEMFAGLVRGIGARQLARQIKPALAGNMARALLIARTEGLRAYRESSQRFYQENDDVVRGWRWVSACNARTCPVCWAMHGSLHLVDEQFVSHPGCRCTPVPVTDLSPSMTPGPVRFHQLSEDDQRQVLGPQKLAAYKAGKIELTALAGMRDSGRWGKTRHERNFADALEATRAGRPLDVGPMRKRPGQPAPAPKPPDEPLEVLLPIVDKQLPAASAAEARQRVVDVHGQYQGMLSAIDDELKQIRQARDFQNRGQSNRLLELGQLRRAVVDARGERLLEILSTEQPATFAVKYKSKVPAERKSTWQSGIDTFKRLVGVPLEGKTVTVKAGGRGRASYDNKGGIHLAPGNGAPVVVHELGHWLEDMSPEVHRKAIDFLERRANGEKSISLRAATGLRGYGRREIAWRDKFSDPYVGKIYRKQFVGADDDKYAALYASEVVSMGLQWYVERAAEFAAEDPDFFDFIFDLVRGR